MTNRAYVAIQSVGAAPATLLADTFSGDSINESVWTPFAHGASGSAAAESGTLNISVTDAGTYTNAGVWTNDSYDFTGTYASVQLVSVGEAGSADTKNYTGILILPNQGDPWTWGDQPNAFNLYCQEGNLMVLYSSEGSGEVTLSDGAYDAESMAYIRVRETSGTTYFDTSPDGSDWTTQASIADPFDMSALYVGLVAQQWGGGDASTAEMANFTLVGSTYGAVANATVVILNPDGDVVSYSGSGLPDYTQATFTYPATNEDIRIALVAAVQSDADDDTLDVEFVIG